MTDVIVRRIGYGNAYSLGVYLATRAAVALGVIAAYLVKVKWSWRKILSRDDAWWYQRIASHGYPRHLHWPATVPHARYSPWAFYPGYPLTIRLAHEVTRLSYIDASFALAFVFGGLAIRAVYSLGDALGGQTVARGSAALIAAWPGSAAMNMPYSEALFMATAAASMAALLRRRWLLAGLLGAVATGTRAIGLALVVAALIAAGLEIRRRRDWRALIAPALTASGVGAFYLYGWQRTGDALIWRHAEDLWQQKLDFGAAMLKRLEQGWSHRGGAAVSDLLLVVGLTMLVLMLVAVVLQRRSVNWPLLGYAAVAAALICFYSNVGPRPRMVLAVIPGFVWVAKGFPPRVVELVTVGFASALALTAFLYVAVVVP